ncbi:MAG: LamG-like jellyroll fold domain-containing protein [Candidatus Hermodarchaeia archaeon]|jgi:hypothetical protein
MTFSTKSVIFDGISGYVDMGDESAFQKERTNAFSMSCWAKTRAASSVNTLMAKMTSATGKAGYMMFLNASGQFEAVLRNTEATDSLRVRTEASRYNDGGWHHYAMTYDGAGSLKLYVDGIVKSTTTVYSNLTSSILISKSLQVGAYDGATDPFDGLIDEVAFFNIELSASIVLDIFSSASPVSLSGAPGLVGWWSMGDGDVYPTISARVLGTGILPNVPDNTEHDLAPPIFPTIMDESGNDYHGYMTNMESADVVSDTPGGTFSEKSVLFDGVDEHVVVGNVLSFEYTDSFSISCWFKTTDSGVLMMAAKMGDGTAYRGYQLYLNAGELWFYLGNNNGATNRILVRTTNTFNDGSWKHAVVTWAGSVSPDANDVTLYINGSSEAYAITTNALVGTITTPNSFYLAGRASSGSLFPFNGYLDEIAAYDKELSSAEVTAIYNAGIPNDLSLLSSASNLVGWWRMGDSATRNDGTALNMGSSNIVRDVPRSDFCKYSTYFDGTADYYTMGNVSALDFSGTTPFSISVWVKTTLSARAQFIVSKAQAPSPEGYWLLATSTGKIVLALMHTNSTNHLGVRADDFVVNDGAWHHIVATYDGSRTPAGIRLWMDSVESASYATEANTLTSSISNSASFRIGDREYLSPAEIFSGNITEVSVYNKELSSDDVAWIYNSGLPRDLKGTGAPSNLAGWWRCGTIERTDVGTNDLAWGSSAETSTNRDMSRFANHATPYNIEVGDFTSDTPGGEAQYSVDLGDDVFSTTSVYFDSGYDNHVTMGNPAALNFDKNDPFSISFWIKTTDTGRTWIMSKQELATTFRGYNVQIGTSENLIFQLWSDNATSDYWVVGSNDTTGWRDGSWHHIVWTIDGSADRAGVTLYIDASPASVFVSGGTTVISGTTITSTPFKLGVRDDEKNNVLRGGMDEWAIYNKELSAAEVTWIYNGGTPRDLTGVGAPSNLVGWWTMGDGDTYPTLTDNSTNSNDGTMTNMSQNDIVGDVPAASADVEYLRAPYSAVYGFESSNDEMWCVGAWIKTTGNSGTICHRDPNSPTVRVGWGVGLTNGYPMTWWSITYPGTMTMQRSDVQVNDGAWHHILVRRRRNSGGTPACVFYVDGVITGTVTVQDTNSNNTIGNGGYMVIGASRANNTGEAGYPFKGKIAEVSVWRGLLQSDQVAAIYNSGSPPDLTELDSEPNLVGWWRCGDDSGNPGTAVSMATSSRVGDAPGGEYSIRSLKFDGSNEYVSLGNILNYERTDPFSFSVWFKAEVGTSNSAPLTSWNDTLTANGWYFAPKFTGSPEFRMTGSSTTDAIRIEFEDEEFFKVAEWYHVVVTYSGSSVASGVKLYVNGRERFQQRILDNDLVNSIVTPDPIRIGYLEDGSYWNGEIDEVSIWGRVLTQAEVTELYNGGAPASLSTHSAVADLDGWWHLGDEGIDATMTNMDSGDLVTNAPKSPGLLGQQINYYTMRGLAATSPAVYHHWTVSGSPDFDGSDAGSVYLPPPDTYSPLTTSIRFNNPVYEYIHVDHWSGIDFYDTDTMSMGIWCKTTYSASADHCLFCIHHSSTGDAWMISMRSASGRLRAWTGDAGAGGYVEFQTVVNDGQWHHVVLVYPGGGVGRGGFLMYVDGEAVSLVGSGNIPQDTKLGYGITIALKPDLSLNPDWPFPGNMCHACIYDKNLSLAEVQAIYNQGLPPDLSSVGPTGNLVWWSAIGDGDAVGTGNILDLTSGGNDGTYVDGESGDFVADVPYNSDYETTSFSDITVVGHWKANE